MKLIRENNSEKIEKYFKEEIEMALLIATGSEVNLAVDAQKALEGEGISAAVISMPSWDRFDAQPQEYKDTVIPKNVKARLTIEMGASLGWHKYAGDEGDVLAIDQFGASAPGERIIKEYGFTVENVVAKVKGLVNK